MTTLPARRGQPASPVDTYLARLAPSSRRSVLSALKRIARELGSDDVRACPWHELRYEHIVAMRAGLQAARMAPGSVNYHIVILRGVLHEAWLLKLISDEDYHRARAVRQLPNPHPHRGRALATSEIAALLLACNDGTPKGARDGAMLAVFATCGLRRAELAQLDLRDYDAEAGTLEIRHGKGDKRRLAYLTPSAVPWLERWIEVRGRRHGPLFYPTVKGGGVALRRMALTTVWHALADRAALAGLEHVEPHDLRRTFATDLLRDGVDLATVARLMGHASSATTEIYDYRSDDEDRAVVLKHVRLPGLAE